jgi:hypothetical protein
MLAELTPAAQDAIKLISERHGSCTRNEGLRLLNEPGQADSKVLLALKMCEPILEDLRSELQARGSSPEKAAALVEVLREIARVATLSGYAAANTVRTPAEQAALQAALAPIGKRYSACMDKEMNRSMKETGDPDSIVQLAMTQCDAIVEDMGREVQALWHSSRRAEEYKRVFRKSYREYLISELKSKSSK